MKEEYDFESMDNETLSAAGVLLLEGRQYEGIEEQKDEWIEVAKERL